MVPEYKTICPHCKNNNIVKRGTFQTKAHGKQQRYFCKNCNKKFIQRTGFYRMRNNPKKITLCLDLFYRGISTRKIQEHLQAFYPANSSHKTIYKWVVKYSNQISTFTDKLKLNVGKETQIDEMEYHRRKSHKKGSKGVCKDWFIDAIDVKTRFMVSSGYFKSRGNEELKSVLGCAKKKTDNQVKIITTDGFHAYFKAIHKTFVLKNKTRTKKSGVIHNRVVASNKEGFNHAVERMHNSVRQRTQNFRGFHGSVESANAIMKGFEVYYNFIRKHQALGKCPYELATDIKIKHPNKWLGLIELSKKD